jgi:predicted Zn finger-like uncharacterized protein
MIITCEECNSSFSVNDSLIKDTGSKVRCSKCDSVFVAFPISTEDELSLDFEGEMLGKDDELGLDDLDSDFGGFLDDDKEDQAPGMPYGTEESELDLNGFDDRPNAKSELEPDDVIGETEGELEFDLDFDQNDDSDLMKDEEAIGGNDLPDLDGDDGLGLPELDLEEEDISALEDQSAEQVEAMEVEEADELDLSDLESFIDDESVSEETAEADMKVSGLDLEMDDQGAEEVAEAGLEAGVSDELDLSGLDLEMEEASASEKPSGTESEDLDLDFDLEAETVADNEEAPADGLDLSDLTGLLEDEKAPAAEAQLEGLDLDLELESGASTGDNEPMAAAESGDIGELNLSDLEDFIEIEDAPATQAAADDSALDFAMDLDLPINDGAPTTEAADDSQGDDELDFSDLEQMLESDETPSVEATDSSPAEEFDLQFDMDEPPTAGADAEVAADTVNEAQDDDFLDIEQLLEDGDGEDSKPSENAGMNGNDTLMPLEMQAALDDAAKGADAELELDFDLESELQSKIDDEDLFDTSGLTDPQSESNLTVSDEVDFLEEAGGESDFEDTGETSVINTDEFTVNALEDIDTDHGATHMLPFSESELPIAESLEQAPVVRRPQPKKTRSKKPLLVVVLLCLLAIGVTIIPNMLGIKIPYISDIKIPYLSDLDVNIPYLSDWLNPKPQDVAGNLKINPLGNTIKAKFVDNSKSGQLFVIQGQIKNDYGHPRSYIKVTGKLLQKGKKLAKTATVYCGNMLSNSDLATMDITEISKKLNNRTGGKRSNFKVKTGNRVPFMIVFDKLPGNLDEYTVEVEGSSI